MRLPKILLLVTVSLIFSLAVLPGATALASDLQAGTQAADVAAGAQATLTMKEAVKTALDKSFSLKALEEQIDKAKDTRDDLADDIDYIPAAGVGAVSSADAKWVGLLKANMDILMKNRQFEDQQKQLALDVVKKYIDVLIAEESVRKAEAVVKRDQSALKVLRAKVSVGMATQIDLTVTKAQAESSNKALEAARNKLEKAYSALNQLMGTDPSMRYEVIVPAYKPLDAVDVEFEASRAVSSNYDIWALNKKTEIEGWDLDYPFIDETGKVKKYNVEKHDVTSTELTRQDAENVLREQVRQAYHEILATEEQLAAAREGVKAAQENLRRGRLQYDVGLISRDELQKIETALVEAEVNVLTLECNHFSQIAAFYRLTGRDVLNLVKD